MNYIGIDLSHKSLVVAINVKGKSHSPKTYENTISGHKAIIKNV